MPNYTKSGQVSSELPSDNSAHPEDLSSHNPEKLPFQITVFRTMSSTEFHKFISGEKITSAVEKDQDILGDITTADVSAIWFSPDRAEYSQEPSQTDSLVSPDLPKLDIKEVGEVWQLGRGGALDPITNNLIVEFSTDKKPGIAYGKYDEKWVKEYTYPEYDRDDFVVQKVYNLADESVIFDRMSFQDYSSAEEALTEVASRELATEKQMEENAQKATQILKDHALELPSPY